MDIIDRIKLLLKKKRIKREQLANRTNISYARWQAVLNRNVKLRWEEVAAICHEYEELRDWIAFGDTENAESLDEPDHYTDISDTEFGKKILEEWARKNPEEAKKIKELEEKKE